MYMVARKNRFDVYFQMGEEGVGRKRYIRVGTNVNWLFSTLSSTLLCYAPIDDEHNYCEYFCGFCAFENYDLEDRTGSGE